MSSFRWPPIYHVVFTSVLCVAGVFVFADEIWHFQIPRWRSLAEATRLIFTTQDRWSLPSSMSQTSCRRKKPSQWKNINRHTNSASKRYSVRHRSHALRRGYSSSKNKLFQLIVSIFWPKLEHIFIKMSQELEGEIDAENYEGYETEDGSFRKKISWITILFVKKSAESIPNLHKWTQVAKFSNNISRTSYANILRRWISWFWRRYNEPAPRSSETNSESSRQRHLYS